MEPSTSGTSGEIQTDLASKYTIPSISEADSEPLNVTEPSSDPTKMSAYSSSNAGSLMENDLEDIEAGAPTFQSKENIEYLDEENSQLPVERGDDTGLSLADELAQAMGDEDDASNDNVSDFGGGDLSMHQDPDNLGKADVTLVKPALWDDTFGRDTTINHNTDSESRDVQMDDAQHQEAEFAESKSVNEKKTDVETNVDQSPVVANLQLAGYTSLEASAAKVTSPPDATVSTQKASMFGDSHHIEQMKESPVAKLDYYGRRYEVSEEPDRPPVVEDTMTFSSSIAVHSEPLSLWNVEEHLQTQKNEEVNISQINVDEQSSTTAGPNASHELAGLSKFGGFEMSEGKDDTNRNEDAVNEDTIVVSSAISVHAEPSSWSDLERINLNTGFKSLPSFDNQDADSNRAQLSTQFDEFGETEGDAAQEHLEKNLKLATDSADHKDSITDSNISAQKDEEGAAKVEDGSFDGYISSESDVNDKIITDLDDFRSLDISGIGTTVADSRTGFVFREKQEAEESETGLVISHRAGLLDFEHETDQKAGTEEELLETKEIDEKRSSIAFENTAKEKVEVSSMAESLAEVAELQPSNSGRFGWDDQNAAVEESLSNLAVSTTESFNQEIQKEQDSPAEIAKETDLFSSPEVEKKFEPEGTVDEGAMHSKPNVDKEEPSEQLTATLDGGAVKNLLPSAIPDASTLHLDGVKHDQPSSGFEMPETPDPQVSFELNLRDMDSIPEDNETSASDVPHDRFRSMFPHSEESDVDTTLEVGEKFQDDNSGNPTEKQTELCEMEPSTSGASGEIPTDLASKYTISSISEADSEPLNVTEPSSDSTKMSAYGSSNTGSLMENDLENIETGAPTFQSKKNIDYLEEENSGLPDEKGDNTGLSLADELAQAMGDEDDASNANVSDFGGGDLSMHQDPDNLGKADVTLVKPALWDDTFGRDTTFNHNTDSESGDAQMDDARHRGAEFAESKSVNEKKADVEINVNLSPVVADLQLAGYTSLEASAAEVSSPPDATASTQKASLFGESHHIEQTKESPVEKLDYYGRRYEVSEELDRPPVVEDTMTFSSSIAVHSEPPSLWNVEEHLQTQKKEEVNISQINVDEQSSTTEGPNSNQEQTELSKLGGFETSEDKEDTNRKEDAVDEDMIVVFSAAAIHAEPSSWSGLEPFDLNTGFESLPSFDDPDEDRDRAQLSTQLDESGETQGDAAQEFLEKTLEFAIGKQVGEDFDTDTNISDPAASVTERKESIQVQLQTLNDSKEAEPKYSMESWNSQEELSVDLEAEQIQPESFKQTYSSLHRQNSFSSDDEQVRGSLQENETETVETGKSGTNKDLGILSMSVQENRFEDESSAADVALGAPQENIAELADEAKSLPVEEPEKKENYNEETFAPSLEQPRVEGREETQEASSSDIVPVNIGKDEEISSENSDVGIRKVTLKLLDAQDVKVESELRQRNQENGNMTAEPVMQSSDGENGSKNSLEPISSSTIMLGLASDSTDMLADKLDELNTPSIETRELDLSDSMLNVMIDGPDMEQPIRRQTARGLESEALPNQSHSRQATFDLSNSLSLSSPEQTAQTEAEIIDVEIDGQTMQLNMAIASQYKEVFTHGGYTDRTQQQAIVILSACEFPTRRTPNYAQIMDQLFIYVYHKVREIDAPEYALIYLQGGASKSQLPAMKWMKRCHDHLSRSIRKSIKILFIVHPTFWTRTVIFWSRPFVSSKFMRKLHLSPTLEHVNKILSLRDVPIPGKVRMYDATFKR